MSLDIQRIKALCFDVDGTLSNTDDLYVHKISHFFPRFLFRDPNYAARRFVMWVEAPGNALLGLTDTIGLDDEIAALIDWLSRHQKKSSKTFWLIPDVDKMLAQLKGHYPMAVVSARDEKGTMRFLEQFDLVKYFDVIVTGQRGTRDGGQAQGMFNDRRYNCGYARRQIRGNAISWGLMRLRGGT